MIPIKSSQLKYNHVFPKNIIIHSTNEITAKRAGEVIFDNDKYQTRFLQNWNYKFNNQIFLPYHYVVEKVSSDYQVVIQSPLFTKCAHVDIPEEYDPDVHIAIIGNYDEDIADANLYNTMALQIIIPLMKAYRIQEKNILFHREVSTEEITCPGEFFLKNRLISAIRRHMKNRTVTRKV